MLKQECWKFKGLGGAARKAGLRNVFAGTALVLIVFLAYSPAWNAGFVWDDDSMLTNNPLVKQRDNLAAIWASTKPVDYFPLTYTSLWLEWRLWGERARGYHLTNLGLHALSAVLLWRVAASLELPGAWFAGLIFAVHPVNVESVAWIAERKNALAMPFFLASLLAYLRFERGRPRWYWVSLVLFVLSLLSKTAGVTLPAVLLLVVWWRRGRLGRRDWARSIPFFLVAAALSATTIWFQSHRAIGGALVRTDGLAARCAVAGRAVWFYLAKALLPVGLSFVYPRWEMDAASAASYLPALAALAALLVLWARRRSWGRDLFASFGCYIALLLPTIGLINIYFMRYSLVADHWQYFAIPVPILLAAAWLCRGPRGRCAGGLVAAALACLCWRQATIYADSEALYRATIAANPDCWLARDNLGNLLADRGRPDDAVAQYEASIRVYPLDPVAHNGLGNTLAGRGEIDRAIAEYQLAVEVRPEFIEARVNLGYALARHGDFGAAMACYQDALGIDPPCAAAHLGMARLQYSRGRNGDAIEHCRQAIQLGPDAAAINLLAWIRATCPDAALRDGAEAVRLAQRAVDMSPGRPPAAILDTLAAAYAEAGRFSEAVAIERQALAGAGLEGDVGLANEIRGRILVFQSGNAFRNPAHPEG